MGWEQATANQGLQLIALQECKLRVNRFEFFF